MDILIEEKRNASRAKVSIIRLKNVQRGTEAEMQQLILFSFHSLARDYQSIEFCQAKLQQAGLHFYLK